MQVTTGATKNSAELYSNSSLSNIPRVDADWQVVSCLPTEIMAEEEPSDGMQHPARHLHHVLHDLLDGGVGDRHVHGADCDHEVESGDDVASILYKLVQIGEVVAALSVSLV